MRRNKLVNELRRQKSPPNSTSQLINDSGFIDHVDHLVKSVNGQQGDVTIVIKRVETFMGITDLNGDYSVTYDTAYLTTPDIQPQMQSGTPSRSIRIKSSTNTGFTVNVTEQTATTIMDREVISSSATPVSGASVSVLVTER